MLACRTYRDIPGTRYLSTP